MFHLAGRQHVFSCSRFHKIALFPKYKHQMSHTIRTCVEDFMDTSDRHDNIFAKVNFYSPCPFRSSFAAQQPDSCPYDTNGRPLCSGLPTQRIEGAACFWNSQDHLLWNIDFEMVIHKGLIKMVMALFWLFISDPMLAIPALLTLQRQTVQLRLS